MTARPALPSSPLPLPERALAPQTAIDEFEVERVLAQSSFSIVYRAYDHVLKLHVAIKEYLPDALALRGGETQVMLRDRGHAERFQAGAQAFVGEAQTLARCDHPSLVRVVRILQRHGTYYRVLRYTPGPTLQAWRQEAGSPPAAHSLRSWLDGLLGALEALHEEGCVHGAVTPANVLLLPGDKAVLLDFDAVRGALLSDHAQGMMTAFEPCFTPPEQHEPSAQAAQGPWTDLYALAATLHYAVGGQLPPPAGASAAAPFEPFVALWTRLAEAQPTLGDAPAWLAALDACLLPDPQQRPQTVAELRARLAAADPAPARRGRAPRAGSRRGADAKHAAGTKHAPAAAGGERAAGDAAAAAPSAAATPTAAAASAAAAAAAAASASPAAPDGAAPAPSAAAGPTAAAAAPPAAPHRAGHAAASAQPVSRPPASRAFASSESARASEPPSALPSELPSEPSSTPPSMPPPASRPAAARRAPTSTPQARVIADLDATFAFIARQATADAAAPAAPDPHAAALVDDAATSALGANPLAALLATRRGRIALGVLVVALLAAVIAAAVWLYQDTRGGLRGDGLGAAVPGTTAVAATLATLAPLPADADAAAARGAAARDTAAGSGPGNQADDGRGLEPGGSSHGGNAGRAGGGAAPVSPAARTAPATATTANAGPAARCSALRGSAFDRCLRRQCKLQRNAGHADCAVLAHKGKQPA